MMSEQTYAYLNIDGTVKGFILHRLPANKPVAVAHAIRDSETGWALLVDSKGKIYTLDSRRARMYSWQHGVSAKVGKALVSLGVITQEQYDGHVGAVAAHDEARNAAWSLEYLTAEAAKHGIVLSGEAYDALVAKAAKFKEYEVD